MSVAQVWAVPTLLAKDMFDIALLSFVLTSEAPSGFGLVDGTTIRIAALPRLRHRD
jgi:hypothetical protein